jgi:hypothetical protein
MLPKIYLDAAVNWVIEHIKMNIIHASTRIMQVL